MSGPSLSPADIQVPEHPPVARYSPRRLTAWLAFRRVAEEFRKRLGRRDIERGNHVKLLRSGQDALSEMERAIRSARHHIHVEMYMILDDRVGRRMLRLLAAQARRGVAVRLIYDAIGSNPAPRREFRNLERSGGEVHVFNPINFLLHPRELTRRRNHRKLVIVDGHEAFVGGVNWTEAFDENPSCGSLPWHDHAVRIRGPAVAQMTMFFFYNWTWGCGRSELPGSLKGYFPPVRKRGNARVVARSTRSMPGRDSIYRALLAAIDAAKRDIRIMHSYFIPNRKLRHKLADAVRRGVSVSVITPGVSDVSIAQAASRYGYRKLLRDGIAVAERQGPVLHAKTVTIDGRWSMVGSSNINYRSFSINLELSVEVRQRRLAQELEEEFGSTLNECTPITMTTVRRWSLTQKIYQFVCYQFRYWM